MPGVESASSATRTASNAEPLWISVAVPTATHLQIVDIVNRINAVRGDAFAKYDQSAEFSVTPTKWDRVSRGAV